MSRFQDQSPGEMFVGALTWPFRFFASFLSFMVQSWTLTRSGFSFLRGLPAILVAGGFLATLWFADFRLASRNEARTAGYYQFHMQNQTVDPEYNKEYAEWFAERLVELRPDSDDYRFKLGLAKEGAGKLGAARDLVSALAPEDGVGLAEAHVWMSQDLMRNQDLPQETREQKSIRHLENALESDPENIPALLTTAAYYEKAGDLEKASKYLSTLVRGEIRDLRQLMNFPRLVSIQQKLGRDSAAESQLNSMIDRIKPLTRRFPDEFRIWETLVRCAILLKDFDQAEDIIQEGFQTATSLPVRQNIARLSTRVLVEKADVNKDMANYEQFRERLTSLARAVQGNPNSPVPYSRLLEFVTMENTDKIDYDFWLRDAKIGADAPGVIHLVIGFREIAAGNISDGQRQWRIAESEMLLAQAAITNLISAATYDETGKVADTKDLIAIALDLFPEQMRLYFIRGNLLKDEGEVQEAIRDFEYIVEKQKNDLPAHEQLAECYEKLNNQEKASKHRREAEVLYGMMTPQQRRVYDLIKARQ